MTSPRTHSQLHITVFPGTQSSPTHPACHQHCHTSWGLPSCHPSSSSLLQSTLSCLSPRQRDRLLSLSPDTSLASASLHSSNPMPRMFFLKWISKQVTSLIRSLPLGQRIKFKHLRMAFETFHKLSPLHLLPSSPRPPYSLWAPTSGSHPSPIPVYVGTRLTHEQLGSWEQGSSVSQRHHPLEGLFGGSGGQGIAGKSP